MSGRAVLDLSGLAFASAAVAFTASGQSIIVDEAAPNSTTTALANVARGVFDLAAGCEAGAATGDVTEWAAGMAARLAQQSCECIEAQAPPSATTIGELAGDSASFEAAALTIFSQPSIQPAPAIQRATASASVTRTILMEERNLISMLSLIRLRCRSKCSGTRSEIAAFGACKDLN